MQGDGDQGKGRSKEKKEGGIVKQGGHRHGTHL